MGFLLETHKIDGMHIAKIVSVMVSMLIVVAHNATIIYLLCPCFSRLSMYWRRTWFIKTW
jgi:hypothetical protein